MRLRIVAVLAAGLAFAGSAPAQYPSRVIRIVPNSAPGTGPDITARLVAAKLTELLQQSVVVENRSGANGNIAGEYVAKSPPDGYTLLLATVAQFTINPHLYSDLRFDWNKDLVPVCSITTEEFKLVTSPAVPARTLAEFIAYARSVRSPLFYGSAGSGSLHHLAMELFKEGTGANLSHVPYKGGGSAVTMAMLSGEVSVSFGGSAIDGQIRAGKLRALAVTGPARSSRFPDLPTMSESIPGFETVSWNGLFAPAGAPQAALARLRVEMARVLALPEFKAKVHENGPEVWMSTPEEFAAVIRRDYEKNGKIVKKLDIRMD